MVNFTQQLMSTNRGANLLFWPFFQELHSIEENGPTWEPDPQGSLGSTNAYFIPCCLFLVIRGCFVKAWTIGHTA